MKQILGIIASPRKLGNSEMVIKEICKHVPEKHTLRLIRLSDFDIKPCLGCYRCLIKDGKCIIEDDIYKILDPICKADGLIVAAPAYFLGPNASLKRFLDRGLSFYARGVEMWNKPSIGIGIAGIQGKEGYTLLGVQNFLKMLLTNVKMTEIIYGALPGEVFMNDKNLQVAKTFGKALFGEPRPAKTESCPLCGGDTFRFLEKNRVRCMLCSNTGTMEMTSEGPVFHIEKDEHGMFLSIEDLINHGQWLRSMKDRFREQKEELKRISLGYREGGEWIKP